MKYIFNIKIHLIYGGRKMNGNFGTIPNNENGYRKWKVVGASKIGRPDNELLGNRDLTPWEVRKHKDQATSTI
jgi:hypothetical protein